MTDPDPTPEELWDEMTDDFQDQATQDQERLAEIMDD